MKNMKEIKKLKIGIVGHGFVGKATDWGFNKNVEKFVIDPVYGTSIKDLNKINPEIVFICVPTPMASDGSHDFSIIVDVINQLRSVCPNSIKVVKSTVLPSILSKLVRIEPKLIYNPEFLREKYANEDFENSEMIILGGQRNISEKVSNIYKKHSKCERADHIFTDLETASLIKYAINTFLASKVIFFNELNSMFNQLNVTDSWNSVTEIISKDKRIGGSHMDVPGHDGKKGYGGACFPKDTVALAKYAEEEGVQLSLLKTVIKINNRIRSQYPNLDKREKEQNILFEDFFK
jgi:nucleotide sugar dehydrogenase